MPTCDLELREGSPGPSSFHSLKEFVLTDVEGVWSIYDADGSGQLDIQEFARFFEVLNRRSAAKRSDGSG